jgi:hypothetical protein
MKLRSGAIACVWLLLAIAAHPASAPADVQIEMKNVRLHVTDDVILDVARLRGVMISKTAGVPPIFDDQRSYTLRLFSAELSMDMSSLQNLMNRHVFAYEGSPLSDLTIRSQADRLVMNGKLRKGVAVPISATTSVSATPEGLLRLHVESMKALGVPAKGLLNLFGLEVDDVMDIKKRRGVDVQENDILIAAGEVLPPPEIKGRLARVEVRGDRLLQIFEDGSQQRPVPLTLPAPAARNYIYFGGGNIRFGKLTMHDTDLQLIDADPKDPFDFFTTRYNAQLVAGYSKNTPSKGLKTFMPDYADLKGKPPK